MSSQPRTRLGISPGAAAVSGFRSRRRTQKKRAGLSKKPGKTTHKKALSRSRSLSMLKRLVFFAWLSAVFADTGEAEDEQAKVQEHVARAVQPVMERHGIPG